MLLGESKQSPANVLAVTAVLAHGERPGKRQKMHETKELALLPVAQECVLVVTQKFVERCFACSVEFKAALPYQRQCFLQWRRSKFWSALVKILKTAMR